MRISTIKSHFIIAAIFAVFFLVASQRPVAAQTVGSAEKNTTTPRLDIFRVGEKLSYRISFEKFDDVGFIELYVASSGKIGQQDVVEIRSKIKTYGIVEAAFGLIDEERTIYAAVDTGMPVYIKRTDRESISAKTTVIDGAKTQIDSLDLITLIYKLRNSTAGTSNFTDGDLIGQVSLLPGKTEKISIDAGTFDSNTYSLQSTVLLEQNGFKEAKLWISSDDAALPLLLKLRSDRGDYSIRLASVSVDQAEPSAPKATPTPIQTPPQVRPSPRPQPTPTPYVNDQPLLPELLFKLGEKLNYRLTQNGRQIGNAEIAAVERRQINGQDTLLLTAQVINGVLGGAVSAGDRVTAYVDPDTLVPISFTIQASGVLSSLNQSTTFDQKNGGISFRGNQRVDAPIGTHSMLSLLYAMRSFNLKPSKTISNPVNDTRVAVFWADRPYIFVLRPSDPGMLTVDNKSVPAQMISITTGNPQLDALQIKVWLSMDIDRAPLRISIGSIQADLIMPPAKQ